MWIFTQGAFLSVVQKPGQRRDMLTVRARVAGDLERVFPGVKVDATRGTDYAYRAEVSRHAVETAIRGEIQRLNYPNFKAGVMELDRHTAYFDVWRAMARFQEERAFVSRQRGVARGRRR